MIPEIVLNTADVMSVIPVFFIRMIFTGVITAPIIIFSAAVSMRMKAPRRYAYRMWCMAGAAALLLITGSVVSMIPADVVWQPGEEQISDTEVQSADELETDNSAKLQNEASDNEAAGHISERSETSKAISFDEIENDRNAQEASALPDAAPVSEKLGQFWIITQLFSASALIRESESKIISGAHSNAVSAAAMLYAAAAAFMIFINTARYMRLRKKLKTACLVKIVNGNYAERGRAMKNRKVNVYESADVITPFTLGMIKPAIFIMPGMDQAQLDNVIRHELAHTSRHDQLKMSLAVLIRSFLWFDPFVWLAVSMFRRDMELSCDDIAVNDMDLEARRSYVKVLIDVAGSGGQQYGPALFMSDRRYFESRVINILNNNECGNAKARGRRTAAVLMEEDLNCMEMKVPSDGFALSDGSRINNWSKGDHNGQDITLRQAFSEMSNAGRGYAIVNADDKTVEKLKGFYDPDALIEAANGESDEVVRVKLAAGQYSMKLKDLAGAMLRSIGDVKEAVSDDNYAVLDTQQRAELRKIFREGLGWYYEDKADSDDGTYFLTSKQAREMADNVHISAAFGTHPADGSEEAGRKMIESVCAGYGAYNGKSVYFAVQAISDPLSSKVGAVYGDELAYVMDHVFTSDEGSIAGKEYYKKSVSFDLSAAKPYDEITAWDDLYAERRR